MKALVYQGPGKKSWQDAPEPRLRHPTDAIVRMDTTTICGTDLHILKGDVPAVQPGRILGVVISHRHGDQHQRARASARGEPRRADLRSA